jgi:hypothetical protein
MKQGFILIVTGLTSVAIYLLGVKGLRLSKQGLWLALGKAFECLGLTLALFLLNLAVGIIAILATRSLIGRFISLYHVSDATLLVLSLLQALTFQAWREGSRHRHTPAPQGSGLIRREP